MKVSVKAAAVILLLAFISPALWAVSDCIGKGLEVHRCKQDCPMMQMNAGGQDEISAGSATDHSCCTVSSSTPVSDEIGLTLGTYTHGNLQPAPVPANTPSALIRMLSGNETPPLSHTSSHQALLCVFLV